MLREISPVHQRSCEARRRWFQDEDLDLFVWQDAAERPIALHLCYERRSDERALTWREGLGFGHHRVDQGERIRLGRRSPVLVAGGPMPYFAVLGKVLAATATLEPAVRDFVLARLREYRIELFGRPRKPRRRRRTKSALLAD